MKNVQKIKPYFWFDDQAEEAIHFYVSIFNNSRIVSLTRFGKDGPGQPGGLMTAEFELEGQRFLAINGGPQFQFTEATSFFVDCDTQEEVDTLWTKLISDGGQEGRCGWLKDKFGLSWQIVPSILSKMINDPDPVKSGRALNEMYKMNKLEIGRLKRAFDGEATTA